LSALASLYPFPITVFPSSPGEEEEQEEEEEEEDEEECDQPWIW
jgi:hypothetical protein